MLIIGTNYICIITAAVPDSIQTISACVTDAGAPQQQRKPSVERTGASLRARASDDPGS